MYHTISTAKAFARDLKKHNDVSDLLPNPEQIRQSGPFESIEQFVVSAFDQFGELMWLASPEPDHDILDYGCGHARMAMAFSKFLDKSGSYYGFDIDKSVISANAKRFASQSNIQFRHEDIFSKRYNPDGGTFNVLDTLDLGKKFDLIFLFSVFTHILAHDCDRLIAFLKRHMKPDAAFHSSWFLLNDRAEAGIKAGTSHRTFPYTLDEARLDDEDVPEAAVAFEEGFVLERFRAAGFTDLRVVYGRWSGWKDAKVWQDVIIARAP